MTLNSGEDCHKYHWNGSVSVGKQTLFKRPFQIHFLSTSSHPSRWDPLVHICSRLYQSHTVQPVVGEVRRSKKQSCKKKLDKHRLLFKIWIIVGSVLLGREKELKICSLFGVINGTFCVIPMMDAAWKVRGIPSTGSDLYFTQFSALSLE